MKKNKKIQPNLLEIGCEVSVPYPIPVLQFSDQANNNNNSTAKHRPGKVIKIMEENKLCDVQFTDSEGGIGVGIPQEIIQFTINFNFQENK